MIEKWLALLIFIIPFNVFSQEIFTSSVTQSDYISLGSFNDGETQIKAFDIQNNRVIWLEKASLQHTGQLSVEEFADTIFAKNLSFHVEGYEPFWSGVLREKTLSLSAAGSDKEVHHPIHIALNKNDINSYLFLLMFQSQDKTIYGVIRGLSGQDVCGFSLEEEITRFEVFINNQGQLHRGCATIS